MTRDIKKELGGCDATFVSNGSGELITEILVASMFNPLKIPILYKTHATNNLAACHYLLGMYFEILDINFMRQTTKIVELKT